MSGVTARRGFAFQDLVLAERVLDHIVARRSASIAGIAETERPSLRFGIEAAAAGETPDWDSLESDATRLILEETKSGAVDADDRWALWLRIRRTVSGLPDDTRELSVRLTMNRASLPAHPDRWRTLATLSQSAPGTWSTSTPRRSVRTAEDLANEALHVLTSADADEGPDSQPLSLERARRVLAGFEFNDKHTEESIEEAVRAHLAALSRDFGVDQLLAGLRGEIARRAESRDESLRRFTAEDLCRSLDMLQRLAAIDAEVLDHWYELKRVAALGAIDSNAGSDGLAYQDWKTLQPDAAGALANSAPNAVALLGPGGIGKSVLLARWLAERRDAGDEALFLSADHLSHLKPDKLSAALDLGAFSARHRGHRLVVGVDALENEPDPPRRIQVLAALRASAATDVTVCVTARLLEWRSARGTAESIEGWTAVELEGWPEERVRELVDATGTRRVLGDLLRLLRTPLLLDLFLRTFGRDADVPSGMQTRHGLLQAYWDRRVLPGTDERSANRREALLRVASSEATGVYRHTLTGDAARDLTSEGLLVLVPGGIREFRHALLRDFTMRIWAHDGDASAEEVGAKLEAIRPSLVQFGALRAVLEASAVAHATTGLRLVSGLRRSMLLRAATVLGEFEDPSPVSLTALVDAVREEDKGAFLQNLVSAIKLDRNLGWASLFAALPDDSAWAQTTDWLTPALLGQIVDAFAAMRDEVTANTSLCAKLASRLRRWSLAPRLRDDYALGNLATLLSQIDPSPETVDWLTRTAGTGPTTRFRVLAALPALVGTLVAKGHAVDDDALRLIYCAAAGLRDDGGRLRDDVGVPRDPVTVDIRVVRALIGEGGSKGLITSRPSAFVAVAIDLIAGNEADASEVEAARARERAARLRGFFGPSERVPGGLELAARAAAGEELPDAGGALVVDHHQPDPYWKLDEPYETLLVHLRDLAATSLEADGEFFDALFWPSVVRSRSALARACVLDLLTRREPCPREGILDELLRDGRLYFLECARYYLQRGIRTRWPILSTEDKQCIRANVPSVPTSRETGSLSILV